jgi:hypothetical protein
MTQPTKMLFKRSLADVAMRRCISMAELLNEFLARAAHIGEGRRDDCENPGKQYGQEQ